MTKKDKSRIFSGLVLILLGLSLTKTSLFAGFAQNTVLLVLGGLFIAWYFYSNAYGMLIPGCILTGLGLGSVGTNYFWYSPHNSSLGLGLGFVAIFLIDRLNSGRSHWWPLIPGAVIILSALSRGALGVKNFFRFGWPIILILIGLWIIARSTGIIKNSDKDNDSHPLNKEEDN